MFILEVLYVLGIYCSENQVINIPQVVLDCQNIFLN